MRAIDDVEPFIALNRMTYERQGMPMPYSAELIRRLDAACSARGVRRICSPRTPTGSRMRPSTSSGIPESAYYLMGRQRPQPSAQRRDHPAHVGGDQVAGQVTRRYDFEGSMLRPVERFFRAFGGRQVQFPRLTCGTTSMGQLALMA